jgi:hypothetical protein
MTRIAGTRAADDSPQARPLQEPATLEAAKALVERHRFARAGRSVPPADETVREVHGRASEIVEGRQGKILSLDLEVAPDASYPRPDLAISTELTMTTRIPRSQVLITRGIEWQARQPGVRLRIA